MKNDFIDFNIKLYNFNIEQGNVYVYIIRIKFIVSTISFRSIKIFFENRYFDIDLDKLTLNV